MLTINHLNEHTKSPTNITTIHGFLIGFSSKNITKMIGVKETVTRKWVST
jgi:hypothetical protein